MGGGVALHKEYDFHLAQLFTACSLNQLFEIAREVGIIHFVSINDIVPSLPQR